MRKIYLGLALLLAACAENGGPNPIDAQKFLSSLGGPKVPSMESALVESGEDAEKRGDFFQAAQFYQQALDKKPGDREVILPLAECYRRLGQADKALALYDPLLKEDPGNLPAKEGKGLALMAKGDFNTPAQLFDEVVKADSTRWKSLNALGILFAARGMQPEAGKYFEAALKAHPDSPSILNNQGLSQALSGGYDNAIATLTRAAALAPAGGADRKRIDLNTALVYAIAGKLDAARNIATNYYSGAALDNNMGLYAHLAHDDQDARAYLNMALTESKTFYARAWNNLQTLGPDNNADKDNSPDVIVRSGTETAKPVTLEEPKKLAEEEKPAAGEEKPIKDKNPASQKKSKHVAKKSAAAKKHARKKPEPEKHAAEPEGPPFTDDPIAKIIEDNSSQPSDKAAPQEDKTIEDIVTGKGKAPQNSK